MTFPVTAATIGTALRISLSDAAHRSIIDEAILDAISDVEGYLGRAIQPSTYVEEHRWPVWGGWDLTPLDEPVRSITSTAAETIEGQPTGYYTVTYVAGLDCTEPQYRPILRYIKAAVMNSPDVVRLWTQLRTDARTITTLSVEGQSVGYTAPNTELGGGGAAGSGMPGALPKLSSLSRWRRAGRRAYTRRSSSSDIWPYGGPSFGAGASYGQWGR